MFLSNYDEHGLAISSHGTMQSMNQFSNLFSHLEARLVQRPVTPSTACTATAFFQFVTNDTNVFLIQSDASFEFQFQASYKHEGEFYPHPYTLRASCERYTSDTSELDRYQPFTYKILVYLELTRLRDFKIDDLKRYYEVIDKNIGVNEELQDFHGLYLNFHYKVNGNCFVIPCNSGQLIHLPQLISNPWTLENTSTRFRYDAEKREGNFYCEMTLRPGHAVNLRSYTIVLCLTSNTIPAQMDYHALRWICKMKSGVARSRAGSGSTADSETPYYLSHSSGIIVAHVYGPEMKFTPRMLDSVSNPNHVRSCFEPAHFQSTLQTSVNKENGALAILVTKGADYPHCMRDRRRNQDVLRYLPFDEIDNVNSNLGVGNDEIIRRFKKHKAKRVKQLLLVNENEEDTFSQAHVRLHAAAYDENDVLLAEVLSPPLRNSKAFEQLRIARIVQNKTELRANELTHAYCYYDFTQSKVDYHSCPFQFDLVFISPSHAINDEQLLQLFNRPHISVNAQYVVDCPFLLQFTVPNEPRFDRRRVFIRLRHAKSKDYNPSSILLTDTEVWIYYADSASIIDLNAMELIPELNNSSDSRTTNPYEHIELQIEPYHSHSPAAEPASGLHRTGQDFDYFNRQLDTPNTTSQTTHAFDFSCAFSTSESS